MPAQTSGDANGPNFYIFIVASIEWPPYSSGQHIVATLLSRGAWLASRFTPYRAKYKPGDKVLLYVSGADARHFVGDATVAGPTERASDQDLATADKLGLKDFQERIPLSQARLWGRPVPIKPLIVQLHFIKNKANYGLNLRQAAARITYEDYALIMRQAQLA